MKIRITCPARIGEPPFVPTSWSASPWSLVHMMGLRRISFVCVSNIQDHGIYTRRQQLLLTASAPLEAR